MHGRAIASSSIIEDGWGIPSNRSPSTDLGIQKRLEALFSNNDDSSQALTVLFSHAEDANFAQSRNNSSLFKEGIIHLSLESLAMLHPIEESTDKIYCKPVAHQSQEVGEEVPDDTLLIKKLQKRKSPVANTGNASKMPKISSKKQRGQRLPTTRHTPRKSSTRSTSTYG